MSVFYDLPQILQIDLLSQWFRPQDVGRLDSATCNRKWREDFLALLHSPQCFLRTFRFQKAFGDIWLIQRGAKLREMFLVRSGLEDKERRSAVLAAVGPMLKCLDLVLSDFPSDDDIEAPAPVKFADVAFDIVTHCRNIEKMQISAGPVDDWLMMVFLMNTKLKEISLQQCENIPADALQAMLGSPSLESIDINCSSTFAPNAFEFKATGDCPTCTSLSITHMRIDSAQLEKLSMHLPNLTSLKLDMNDCSVLLPLVRTCKHILRVDLSIQQPLLLSEAAVLAEHWQSLEVLKVLYYAPNQQYGAVCSEETVLLLVERCKNLKRLQLARDERMQTYTLSNTPSGNSCVDVRTGCESSGIGGSSTGKTHSSLEYLSLPALSEQGLKHITTHCTNLLSLHLHRPPGTVLPSDAAEFALHHIDNSSIKALHLSNGSNLAASHLLQLHNIEKLLLSCVGTTTTLTNDDIVQLVKQCPALHSLYLHACSGVTHEVAVPVLAARPNMFAFKYNAQHNLYPMSSAPTARTMEMRRLYPHVRHLAISPFFPCEV